MIDFQFNFSQDFSNEEIELLWSNCQKANHTMQLLAKGELSLSDALALCESLDIDPDESINTMYDNFEYLGIL